MAAEASKAAAALGLTHKSSVCLIPPSGLWGPIQDIRRVHDRHYVRWMPHVNLLYPFVPSSQFEDAVAVLSGALCGLQPFTVTLASFHHFNHGKSNTMWLLPETEPPLAIHHLEATLVRAYAQCTEQTDGRGSGFNPHLSVGQWKGENNVVREAEKFGASWSPITYQVDHVCLISRSAFDDPFRVRYRVYFDGRVEKEP